MLNNAYQNLELKIDLLDGGTIAGLKNKIKDILGYKLLIICGVKLDGNEKLPVVCQPNIYITQTEEPDDWDEEEDGEFIPEDVYHLEAKNIYGYDIAIENDIVTCSEMSLSVDSLSVNSITSSEDEIAALKPVVEVMDGYNITPAVVSNLTITPIYTGACKNGNKLTLVAFFEVKKTATDGGDKRIFNVTIPASVGTKLYPFSISPFTNLLDAKIITFWDESNISSSTDDRMLTRKESNTDLYFTIRENNLVIDTNYLVRYEVTFLLSENLAE